MAYFVISCQRNEGNNHMLIPHFQTASIQMRELEAWNLVSMHQHQILLVLH